MIHISGSIEMKSLEKQKKKMAMLQHGTIVKRWLRHDMKRIMEYGKQIT